MSRATVCLCFSAFLAGCTAKQKASTIETSGSAHTLVFISNEGSGELSVIDAASDSVIDRIVVGTRPRGVRVSPDSRMVYVALSGSPRCPPTMPDSECAKLKVDKSKDGIGEVDVATRQLRRVLPGGSDPENFDLSPDGTTLYTSNEDANTASFIAINGGTVLRTVPVGREPEGVAVPPDGKTVWVTSESDNVVTVLDAESGAAVARISVGKRPRDIVFSSNGTRAYVSAEAGGNISVVDAAKFRVLRTIPMPEGAKPMGLALMADGKQLWVANGRAGTVSLLDLESDTIMANVKVGVRPWGLALLPDGTRLYVANGPSGDVSVINTATRTVISGIPTGELPWGAAVARTAH